jgi:hypothetical protein
MIRPAFSVFQMDRFGQSSQHAVHKAGNLLEHLVDVGRIDLTDARQIGIDVGSKVRMAGNQKQLFVLQTGAKVIQKMPAEGVSGRDNVNLHEQNAALFALEE